MDEFLHEKVDDSDNLFTSELEALYQVSNVLSESLDLDKTLRGVLTALSNHANMKLGMVTLIEPDSGELLISAIHSDSTRSIEQEDIRYRPGEGLIGSILEDGNPIVISRIADEPRFLDKLGLYNALLPFVAVPIMVAHKYVGVLAAQPPACRRYELEERARFMEMVANLIGQTVRLSWEVEQEKQDLAMERDTLRRKVKSDYGFSNMVGHTASMKRIFELIRQVAKWNTTVLVRGESGTGKELIANAIHYNSPRANAAFVKLNCAALPDNLLESELFGHEKGAFTGAMNTRKGRFEQANGGTIFLDEIGEISASFQAKLLRVLQEGEFERVGGNKTIKVDVRVIAATNRDLESEVEKNEFREDLYYRLNVMPINLPPLRERTEDIPELANFLVNKISKQQGRPWELTDSALRILVRHNWPGNVRELENRLERAAIFSIEGVIDRDVIVETGLEDELKVGSPAPVAAVDFDDEDMDEREKVIA
ncbi:MAG: nif-specific transcriptional activator NifA, partial [Gammaproteobacteria bacterium]|nr:nif-specific transcriptional activator NifA [Gammaproteobacteria bacterium]